MSGDEFEYTLKTLFENMGYTANKTKVSNDQGVDLVIIKNSEKIAVQAKRYQSKVSNSAIQEVYAGKKYYECDRAMVVTTSDFTDAALRLAHSCDVELVNREKLKKWLVQNPIYKD